MTPPNLIINKNKNKIKTYKIMSDIHAHASFDTKMFKSLR
jgi:hypothetical protein